MDMIYDGTKKTVKAVKSFLKNNEAPSWRIKKEDDGKNYVPSDDEIEIVNLALHLRRPILLGGNPGIGKSTLAKSVNFTLTSDATKLLHWQITTHSVLKDGLYEYDAIARLEDVKDEGNPAKPIGHYVTLGPLGSAFASDTLRVVLMDELDKSDVDFPNNLLHVLEEREFPIPELARTGKQEHMVYNDDGDLIPIKLENGKLRCKEFPLIIMTSNKEREFPPAFNRRILMHDIRLPEDDKQLEERLLKILSLHLSEEMKNDDVDEANTIEKDVKEIISLFIQKIKDDEPLTTDHLMHAVFMKLKSDKTDKGLLEKIWPKRSE